MSPADNPQIRTKAFPFWPLLIAALCVVGAENLLDFRWSLPRLLRLSGGLPILDMRFGYTPNAAYQLFHALGPLGRSSYSELLLTVDLLIPVLLTMLLWSALSRGAFKRFRLFALAGGIADCLENVAILILLYCYPARLDGLVTVAACFTIIKQVSYVSAFGASGVGYVLKVKHFRAVNSGHINS